MTIAGPTLVRTFYDSDNLGTYNTNDTTNSGGFGTDALVAGRLYVVHISSYSAGAAELPTSVTFDPGGADQLSFSRVTDGTTDASQTGFGLTGNTHDVWYAFATADTAASFFRVIFGGTQSAALIAISYYEGIDTSTPIVQVVKATGLSTAPAVTMASFFNSNSALALFLCRDDVIAGGFTPTESRSELYDYNDTERNTIGFHYQTPNGGDTSVGATITSDDWAAVGVEFKAAAAVTFGGEEEIPQQPPQFLKDNVVTLYG